MTEPVSAAAKGQAKTTGRITSLQEEGARYEPSAAFREKARTKSAEEYLARYRRSLDEPEAFWREAAERLTWFEPFEKVMEWELPHAKWFVGGKINLCYNAVDRHLATWRRNKAAIIFEGEPGDQRVLTYGALHREVCIAANVLKSLGVRTGDRVAIYLPHIPEAVIAMLACARIGATHSVVFGGFSATALAERINDAGAVCVVTADGGHRKGAVLPLKPAVDAALESCPTVRNVLVVRRTWQPDLAMRAGRDHFWHELAETVGTQCEAVALDAEHPLFVLYTSGSTGKPKGILHTTGGYGVAVALTAGEVFDLRDDDVYWCTADVGWVTGHSYVVYGPLMNGATVMMYEGVPSYPEPDRFWRIVEKHRVTVLYTAPTAIRAFMQWGEAWPRKHDLSSLRLLGSVGEPINPEAWRWYYEVIGGGRCPVVDTWWQTETGAIMITTLPGAHATKPGSAGVPMFGVDAAVIDHEGREVEAGSGGYLAVRRPWPSMLRTIWGNDERYRAAYWAEVPGVYFTGDGARKDADGYFWVMGRVDDVLNVSGHRLGTAEIESALVAHPQVAEAAVVGRNDALTGQAVVAFVTLRQGFAGSAELAGELKRFVADAISAIARPAEIRFAPSLPRTGSRTPVPAYRSRPRFSPRTRSGKIMRRLLRSVAAGEVASGDTTTLEDAGVLDALRLSGPIGKPHDDEG